MLRSHFLVVLLIAETRGARRDTKKLQHALAPGQSFVEKNVKNFNFAKLDECPSVLVEHCKDCRGALRCNQCYNKRGIVCAKGHTNSGCYGSDSSLYTTIQCEAKNTRIVPIPEPADDLKDDAFLTPIAKDDPRICSDPVLITNAIKSQEVPSVPDNSFSLCTTSADEAVHGILDLEPPTVLAGYLAVEWLLFAGGWTQDKFEGKKWGAARTGNRMTDQDAGQKGNFNFLPSSEEKVIAYSMFSAVDIKVAKKTNRLLPWERGVCQQHSTKRKIRPDCQVHESYSSCL